MSAWRGRIELRSVPLHFSHGACNRCRLLFGPDACVLDDFAGIVAQDDAWGTGLPSPGYRRNRLARRRTLVRLLVVGQHWPRAASRSTKTLQRSAAHEDPMTASTTRKMASNEKRAVGNEEAADSPFSSAARLAARSRLHFTHCLLQLHLPSNDGSEDEQRHKRQVDEACRLNNRTVMKNGVNSRRPCARARHRR